MACSGNSKAGKEWLPKIKQQHNVANAKQMRSITDASSMNKLMGYQRSTFISFSTGYPRPNGEAGRAL